MNNNNNEPEYPTEAWNTVVDPYKSTTPYKYDDSPYQNMDLTPTDQHNQADQQQTDQFNEELEEEN